MSQPSRAAEFQALHAAGCFVMPNPWDAGSAVYLERAGFKAVATTSAGFAFTKAAPDVVGSVGRDAVLAHVREVAAATRLPVNADFQDGFGATPEAVAESVRLCVEAGAAGLSVEDATGKPAQPLYDPGASIARVRAARAAIDATGVPVVLTARCEAYLVGHPDRAKLALERLAAFADAGADCLFAPGVRDPKAIEEMVRAVAPKPLNVLVSSPSPALSVARLADLGVRRISVGSALARVAWGAFIRATQALARGSFEGFADAASFDELNALFGG